MDSEKQLHAANKYAGTWYADLDQYKIAQAAFLAGASFVSQNRDEEIKKIAIEFKNWCDKITAMLDENKDTIPNTYSGLDFKRAYTTAELFGPFIESIEGKK